MKVTLNKKSCDLISKLQGEVNWNGTIFQLSPMPLRYISPHPTASFCILTVSFCILPAKYSTSVEFCWLVNERLENSLYNPSEMFVLQPSWKYLHHSGTDGCATICSPNTHDSWWISATSQHFLHQKFHYHMLFLLCSKLFWCHFK